MAEEVCAQVAHRQLVFTIPKRLTGDNRLGRFPEVASDDPVAGSKRNFQIFDPLSRACGMAEVTQHVPEIGEHQIRYYGWYSNKNRGQRAKTQLAEAEAEPQESGAPIASLACST